MPSYPLSIPATRGVSAVTLRARSVVGMPTSPFTFEQQIHAHQGEAWGMDVVLPPMIEADGFLWKAFLVSLNGMEGTFLMGDPAYRGPRGIATGTPLVKGASQTGKSLITDGWTISTAGILKAGDLFQLGSGSTTRLHMLMADANSNGSGEATLDIWPRLRSSPADNAALTLSNPLGQWRLASNDREWAVEVGRIYSAQFSAIEAL